MNESRFRKYSFVGTAIKELELGTTFNPGKEITTLAHGLVAVINNPVIGIYFDTTKDGVTRLKAIADYAVEKRDGTQVLLLKHDIFWEHKIRKRR